MTNSLQIRDELLEIHSQASSKETSRRNRLLATRSRNDIEDLISVHCKTLSELQKALGPGYSKPKKVREIIEEVTKETGYEVREKANQNKLIPLELVHAVMDYEKIPTWRDLYGDFCHVIAIANLKGGTGKSSSALNIATQLALMLTGRMRVLLLDYDPQGTNSQGTFGAETEVDELISPIDIILSEQEEDGLVSGLLDEGASMEDIIEVATLETHIPNLNVISSFPRDERFYRMAPQDKDEVYPVLNDKVIKHLEKDYDVILIDTPPTASVFNWTAIQAATGVIIPCTPQAADKKSTDYYTKELSEIINNSPDKCSKLSWFRFLATNFNEAKDVEIFERMRDDFGSKLLHSFIVKAESFNIASDEYRSVMDLFKSTRGNTTEAQRCVRRVVNDLRQILIQESQAHREEK